MTLTQLATRIWNENVLFTVLLELTYRCNLDCYFCYNDRSLQGTPLSREQYFQLLEDLREMQVLNLVLSGGEPLAHPHFFAIGARARELGFVTRVKTNGHALNRRLAGRLKAEVDPFGLDISLHGATAEVHDRQTRVEGSFRQLMNNLNVLAGLGLRYRLNATLTRWNEHEVEQMVAIAQERDVPFTLNTSVTPRDDGDTAPLSIGPSAEGVERALLATARRAAEATSSWARKPAPPAPECGSGPGSRKQCGTGSSTVTVDPVGNVLPCVQWRTPVGNLHRERIGAIWSGSPRLDRVRETAEQAKRLVESYGETGRLMNYCIGEAVCRTGSPLQVYPTAESLMKIRLKLISA